MDGTVAGNSYISWFVLGDFVYKSHITIRNAEAEIDFLVVFYTSSEVLNDKDLQKKFPTELQWRKQKQDEKNKYVKTMYVK